VWESEEESKSGKRINNGGLGSSDKFLLRKGRFQGAVSKSKGKEMGDGGWDQVGQGQKCVPVDQGGKRGQCAVVTTGGTSLVNRRMGKRDIKGFISEKTLLWVVEKDRSGGVRKKRVQAFGTTEKKNKRRGRGASIRRTFQRPEGEEDQTVHWVNNI